jgi:hypothetical protein
VTLFRPDRQPLDIETPAAGTAGKDPLIAGHDDHNFFVTLLAPDTASGPWGPMACPSPTAWAAGSSITVRGTTLYPVSHVYGPSQVDELITLTSDRTVTKGVEIQGGVGWSIGVLEAQAHVKLDGSVTTSLRETQQFTLKRGMSVFLAAQIIYRQTTLHRAEFAGPNCQRTEQTLTVLTPINTAYLVAHAR